MFMCREILLELVDESRIKKMKRNEEDKYKHPPTADELAEQKRVEELVQKNVKTAKLYNFREFHIANDEDYMIRKVGDS